MPAEPKLRCPCCGGLARWHDFQTAGQHSVVVRRVLRGLGRGRGFEWSTEAAPVSALMVLSVALTNAADQVNWQLAAIPVPQCPVCGETLSPDPVAASWYCSWCGSAFQA
jgi:hypothetical protein